MAISAKINGQFTSEFAAYTKLTLVNRVQNQVCHIPNTPQSKSMSFQQFMDAIQKDQEVNHSNARRISTDEEANNRIYQQKNGFNVFSNQRFTTIEKAYELGLVDRKGILISSFNAQG
ncbi:MULTISPECIES: hypothetical protein [unclassified Paenibacillus]|uniref:hypothetical protein n=1 Tax=unclassified Paenibacillus TaxID=185978 RepID=UPI00383585EB